MSAPESIPAGYRAMRPGEIIEAGDRFWANSVGPWKEYGDSDHDSNEFIGSALEDGMFAHIRLVEIP